MRHKALILTLAALALLLASATALAQVGGGYDLSWNTIDGGGGSTSGGNYTLDSTVGQADAGAASGGSYTVSSGFWHGGASSYKNYLPFVRK